MQRRQTSGAVGVGEQGWHTRFGQRLGLAFNPCVAERELRVALRGGRPFVLLFLHVLIISAVFSASVWWETHQAGPFGSPLSWAARPQVGRTAFLAVILCQLGLLCVGLPAYSASIITMEREKRTLEFVCVTPLTANDIVSGKCLPVVALGAIMSLISLPVAGLCMLMGGVSPVEAVWAYSYMMVNALWLAAVGVAISAVFRRSSAASAATYVAVATIIGLELLGEADGFGGWRMQLEARWVLVWLVLIAVIAAAWTSLAPFIHSVTHGAAASAMRHGLPLLGAAGAVVAMFVVLWAPQRHPLPLHLIAPVAPMLHILSHEPGTNAFAVWFIASLSLLLVSVLLWRLTVIAFQVRPAAR